MTKITIFIRIAYHKLRLYIVGNLNNYYLCEILLKMNTFTPKFLYITPITSWRHISLERHILSNTEPIGGKDDPDHEW